MKSLGGAIMTCRSVVLITALAGWLLPCSAQAFTDLEDDFENGLAINWTGTNGWGVMNPSPSNWWYRGNTYVDIQSYKTSFVIGTSWSLTTALSFRAYYQNNNTQATASIAFARSTTNPGPDLLVSF